MHDRDARAACNFAIKNSLLALYLKKRPRGLKAVEDLMSHFRYITLHAVHLQTQECELPSEDITEDKESEPAVPTFAPGCVDSSTYRLYQQTVSVYHVVVQSAQPCRDTKQQTWLRSKAR